MTTYKSLAVSCIALLAFNLTACSKKDILHWLQDDDKPTAQSATTATTANPTNNAPAKNLDTSKKEQLVNDLVGVWQSGHELIMMNRVSGKFQLLIGDRFIPVTVGDIDPENRTVNLLFTDKNNGKKTIWTVKKIMADDNKSYHLRLTSNSGEKFDLEFVRKVGTDDLNHIEELVVAARANNTSSPNNQPSATASPTAPDNTATADTAKDTATKDTATKESDSATAYNNAKQSMDTARSQMNKLWNSATPEQKAQLQSEQEAWIAHRDKTCASEAEDATADEKEITRMKCVTRLINERYKEMQAVVSKP